MKTRIHKRVGFSAAILFCLGFIAVLFFATMGNSALVANAESATNPYVLSQMTEEECVEFIVDSGVEIPTDFENSAELGSIVKDMIVAVESNPEYEFVYSYNVTLDFAENIRIAVNNYYGIQGVPQGQSSIMAAAAYTLQDSTFVSNSGYMSYNCYAYSIGRNENPPQYSTLKQYQPGDFSRTSFSMSLSISQMASVVQKDLEALGFVGVSLTTSQPSVQTGEKLICIRKGSSDYHFMRYDAGSWYHKPGFTSILKYKYQPTNSRVWIGEYVDMSGNAYLSSTTYTSDIYFIKYSESLFTTTVSNNTVTITGVKQGVTLSGSVEIPSTINGQAVVAIGNSAFANQTQLSQITIPASVKSIGEYAFKYCYNLTNVYFESNSQLSSVGGGAFAYCYDLTNLILPNGLTIQTFDMDRFFIVDLDTSIYKREQYSDQHPLSAVLTNAYVTFEANGDFHAAFGVKYFGTFTFAGEYEIHGKTCYLKTEINNNDYIDDGTYYGYFEIFELPNNILVGNLELEDITISDNYNTFTYSLKISMATNHHNHHHDPALYSTNTSMGRNVLYLANQFALISGGGYGDYTEVTYDPVKNAIKVKATRDDVTHLYVHIDWWHSTQTWVNRNKRISWVVEVDTGTALGSNITFDLRGKNFNLPPNSIEFSMSGAQTKQFRNTTYVISGISSYALHRNFLVIDVSGLDEPTLATFYIKMVVVNCCYL